MATRRTTQTVTPEGEEWRAPVPPAASPSPLNLPAPSFDDDEREPGERIAELIRESGVDSETSVRVYRRLPNSTKYAWCVNYTAAEFMGGDLGMIRDQWGPGEYSLRVYGGQRGIIAREDIVIAPSANPASVQVPASFPGQKSDVALALEKLTEMQGALLNAVSQRPDPMTSMQTMFSMMRDMREAMGMNAPPPPAAPAQSPTAMLAEVVNAVRTLREVSDEINPKAPDPENPMTLLPQFIELVKAGMQARAGGGDNSLVPAVALPHSIASNPAPAMQENQAAQLSSENQTGAIIMRGIMTESLAMKSRGDSIEKVAEFLADKLPDEVLPYLELPNWFDVAVSFAPELRAHEQWVRDVAKATLDLLRQDDASA